MRSLALLVLLLPSLAHAQLKRVGEPILDTPPPPGEPVEVLKVPTLTVSLSTPGAGVRAGDFSLTTVDGDPQVSLRAEKLVAFRDSDEPLSLIVLVDGKVRFIGDPAPEPIEGESEAAPIPGAYDELRGALEVLSRARARRTRAALWVLGETVLARTELADPAQIADLGARADFAKIRASALRLGLESAHARLAEEPGRRVIILLGDGTDTVMEVDYARVTSALETAGIELYAIVAPSGGQLLPERALHRLQRVANRSGGRVYRAQTATELPQLAENLVADLDNRYTVTFPLFESATGVSFPLDGRDHELAVKLKDQELGLTVRLPLWPLPPDEVVTGRGSVPTWLYFLFGALALVLLCGTVVALHRPAESEEHEPEPEPELAAPPPPPPPPAPPAHTMVLDANPNAPPVVAWLVPLTGPSAYRTIKLAATGRSLIGSAPGCDVLLPDPYVSHEHAEIVVERGVFRLLDRGSRNGVTMNEARITSHELIDNDVFTVGQTAVVFKSIN
jgi:hypothetical protein